MGDTDNFYITFDNDTLVKALENCDVKRAENLILNIDVVKFNLDTIMEMYWNKYKKDIFMYKRSDVERICEIALKNLLKQGKIKAGSSTGHFIVVQPTNNIPEKSEE